MRPRALRAVRPPHSAGSRVDSPGLRREVRGGSHLVLRGRFRRRSSLLRRLRTCFGLWIGFCCRGRMVGLAM